MATLQKLIVCLCLTFGIISGVFATSSEPYGRDDAWARNAAKYGPLDISLQIPGHPVPELFNQTEAIQPDVNDDMARFRRDISFRHPKSSAPDLFYVRKACLPLALRPSYAPAICVKEYSSYSVRVIPDYYAFLFRLTPF